MKRTLNLTWGFVLCLLFFLVCLVSLVYSTCTFFLMKNAVSLDDFNAFELEEGAYIEGELSSYLVNASGLGRSVETISLIFGVRPVYTIEDSEGNYIAIALKDFNTIKAMEELEYLQENPILLQARVTSDTGNYNYEWYKKTFNVQTDEEVEQKVVSTITLTQVSFSNNTKRIQQSAVLLVLSVILFYFLGGIKEFFKYEDYTNKFDLSERKFREVRTNALHNEDINFEFEIRRQRVNLEVLRKKQAKIQKSAKFGMLYIAIAGVVALISTQLSIASLMLVAAVLLVLGLRTLFILFLNSELLMAVHISNLFGFDTVRKEIMMTQKSIKELQSAYNNLVI